MAAVTDPAGGKDWRLLRLADDPRQQLEERCARLHVTASLDALTDEVRGTQVDRRARAVDSGDLDAEGSASFVNRRDHCRRRQAPREVDDWCAGVERGRQRLRLERE